MSNAENSAKEYPIITQIFFLVVVVIMFSLILYMFVPKGLPVNLLMLIIATATGIYIYQQIKSGKPVLSSETIRRLGEWGEAVTKGDQRSNLSHWGDANINSSMDDFLGRQKKHKPRKAISRGLLKRLLVRARGYCEMCKKDLQNVKYDVHHKNYEPTDNRESNLIVLCKSCHKKITGPRPPDKKKDPDFWRL